MECFSRNMGQATASLCRRVITSTLKSQGQVRVADETQFWETWESRGMGQRLILGAQVREGNSSRKNRISQNAVQNRRKDIRMSNMVGTVGCVSSIPSLGPE